MFHATARPAACLRMCATQASVNNSLVNQESVLPVPTQCCDGLPDTACCGIPDVSYQRSAFQLFRASLPLMQAHLQI